MKFNDLSKKKPKELVDLLKETQSELFHLKIKNATQQLEHKHKLRATRRDIARIKTVLTALLSTPSRGRVASEGPPRK